MIHRERHRPIWFQSLRVVAFVAVAVILIQNLAAAFHIIRASRLSIYLAGMAVILLLLTGIIEYLRDKRPRP